ncbi:uncharacterized protein MONBRDRAFT_39070 [Monosiga brevicollis MX1]|uniref:protein-tyrosine-phosphatase n=1 Tax=Monosiga brevicollis TaxID=81824 RepID=A9VC11_MONBE|nr:uncharacterized protein MONBRDRAFT_39070 [Monosiga brevicollis MX1]EDQ84898.1 predicted protein [Monosiga brevicollis MX1]|eukprot:XP_001750239.1 hypothetical protein [Monosiga brevicollis MX1]
MGQSLSVPGMAFLPFRPWDVVFTPNAFLDPIFKSSKDGDYVIRRVLHDPTTLELLVNDGGNRLRYAIKYEEDQYHFAGQSFEHLDILLAHVMHQGVKGPRGTIHLRDSLARELRERLTHYMPMYSPSSWYVGKISAAEAKIMLDTEPCGAWLVRASAEEHAYSLMVKDMRGDINNFLLTEEPKDGGICLGTSRFDRVDDLIRKISKSGLKCKSGKVHLREHLYGPIAPRSWSSSHLFQRLDSRSCETIRCSHNSETHHAEEPTTPPAEPGLTYVGILHWLIMATCAFSSLRDRPHAAWMMTPPCNPWAINRAFFGFPLIVATPHLVLLPLCKKAPPTQNPNQAVSLCWASFCPGFSSCVASSYFTLGPRVVQMEGANVYNSALAASAHERPKGGSHAAINSEAGVEVDSDPPAACDWYAGRVSRQAAAAVILQSPNVRPGDFFFHQHPLEENVFYLTVNDHDRAAQYKIARNSAGYVFGPKTFLTLQRLLETARRTGLKGSQEQLKLGKPVAQLLSEVAGHRLAASSDSNHHDDDQDLGDAQLVGSSEGRVGSLTARSADPPVATEGGNKMKLRKLGQAMGHKFTQMKHAMKRHGKQGGTDSAPGSPGPTRAAAAHATSDAASVPVPSAVRNQEEQPVPPPRSHEPLPPVPTRQIPEDVLSGSLDKTQPSNASQGPSSADLPPIRGRTRTMQMNQLLSTLQKDLDLRILPLDIQGYKELPRGETHESDLPDYARGPRLNRFRDILPNPVTRVRLEPLEVDHTLEYINANYVRDPSAPCDNKPALLGFGGRRAKEYVAAQAPKDTGLFNFWRMIVHVQARCIAMTTGLVEGGKNKCSRYWPATIYAETKEELVYGPRDGKIHVRTMLVTKMEGYIKTNIQVLYQGSTRNLVHFWFTAWPDHGVPTRPDGSMQTQQMIEMLLDIRRTRNELDRAMGVKVDVLSIVADIREDRMAMVQHVVQYRYLYQAVVEYAERLAAREQEEEAAQAYEQMRESGGPVTKSSDSRGIYAVADDKEAARYELDQSWQLHSVHKGFKVYSLRGAMSLPAAADDHEATFAPREQVEAGEVITSPVKPVRLNESSDFIDKPWFRSNFTRAQVEDLLSGTPPGTFVVRPSSKKDHFALSLQTVRHKIANMLIVPIAQPNGKFLYKLGASNDQSFSSVAELVEHYLEHGIPAESHGEIIRLRRLSTNTRSLQSAQNAVARLSANNDAGSHVQEEEEDDEDAQA